MNRFCGSSMQAIHMAAGAIAMGAGEAFIAAGVESMTRVPMGGFNPLPNPKLMPTPHNLDEVLQAYISMGDTAENLAKKYGISRARQEEYALNSHKKAATAQADGRFAAEIVPIEAGGKIVDKRRHNPPRYQPGKAGRAEAGLPAGWLGHRRHVLAFDRWRKRHADHLRGLREGAWPQDHGAHQVHRRRRLPPGDHGHRPVPAVHKALARANLKIGDIDIFELNEAFAAQTLSVVQELGIDEARLNLDGGAIALGHPLGASGARITGKAASNLQREGKSLALATMCIGGGMGIATVMEAV